MRRLFTFALFAWLGVSARVQGDVINIDFGTQQGAPSSGFGGAAGQPGTWNAINTLGLTSNLTDVNGNTTSVSLNLAAGGTFGPGSSSGDVQTLLNDSFFSTDPALWSVTLTGLSNGTYEVYAYAPSNTNVSTGAFTVNGIAVANLNGGSPTDTSLVLNTHYRFVQDVPVTDGTLTFLSTSTFSFRGLAGVQLFAPPAPVPEPSSLILLGLTAGAAGWRWRKRQAA